MLETVTNQQKVYPKRLKKIFQSGVQYKTYSEFIPNMERAVVGNIPVEIINLFDKPQRSEKIRLFQQILADTANYARNVYKERKLHIEIDSKNCIDMILKRKGQETNTFLNEQLKNILPNGYNAEFEYVGYGGFKDVYRLGLRDDKNKKVMHDKTFIVYRNLEERQLNDRVLHGNYAEPNIWTYLSFRAGHPLDKTQYTKHYISDMHAGYSLTEFADKDITKTTKMYDTRLQLGLLYTDGQFNPYLHKKRYDIGKMKKEDIFTDDKLVMRYYKQILNKNTEKERNQVLTQLREKINNPKTPHRDNMQKGVELFYKRKKWEVRTSK